MKIFTVFGTRPEIIKLAPIIHEARRHAPALELVTCSTGQHREMLDQALAAFAITPDMDMAVMQPQQTLSSLTARLIERLAEVFSKHTPDVIIVQGDTTSAMAAAMAAFYQRIPIAHVEAGLRTSNLQHPFPEELNRSLIARMATWHFAPTSLAAANLAREGVAASSVHISGNTVVDALRMIQSRWEKQPPSIPLPAGISHENIALITSHRRENFGEGLKNICEAIRTLCTRHTSTQWLFPVHLNPQVRGPVFSLLQGISNLHLLDPMEYETTLYVTSKARLVITDSGGIQEEAPSFATPAVVMREHTERMEGVTAGFAVLAGTSHDAIVTAADNYLADAHIRKKLASAPNPYGDGNAAERIIAVLRGVPTEAFHG